MTTISEYLEGFPLIALQTMLNQVKEKLGDEFDYTINETEKTVLVIKVPPNYKDNIFGAIQDQGFQPQEF